MPGKKGLKRKKVEAEAEAKTEAPSDDAKGRMPKVGEAAAKLLEYMTKTEAEKNKNELLTESGPVFASVQFVQSMPKGTSRARRAVELPHGIHTRDDQEVCLITSAPQRKWKDMIKEQPDGLSNVKKVIDMNKLRKKFKSYESKRQLATGFHSFIADEAIMEFLPKLLGKTFFSRSKEPICISMKKFPASLKSALSSTSYSVRDNSCVSIQLGTTDFSPAELTANCLKVLDDVAKQCPNGWRDIHSVVLKGSNTPGLAVYAHDFREEQLNAIAANEFPKRMRLTVPDKEEAVAPIKKMTKEEQIAAEEAAAEDSDNLDDLSGLDSDEESGEEESGEEASDE